MVNQTPAPEVVPQSIEPNISIASGGIARSTGVGGRIQVQEGSTGQGGSGGIRESTIEAIRTSELKNVETQRLTELREAAARSGNSVRREAIEREIAFRNRPRRVGSSDPARVEEIKRVAGQVGVPLSEREAQSLGRQQSFVENLRARTGGSQGITPLERFEQLRNRGSAPGSSSQGSEPASSQGSQPTTRSFIELTDFQGKKRLFPISENIKVTEPGASQRVVFPKSEQRISGSFGLLPSGEQTVTSIVGKPTPPPDEFKRLSQTSEFKAGDQFRVNILSETGRQKFGGRLLGPSIFAEEQFTRATGSEQIGSLAGSLALPFGIVSGTGATIAGGFSESIIPPGTVGRSQIAGASAFLGETASVIGGPVLVKGAGTALRRGTSPFTKTSITGASVIRKGEDITLTGEAKIEKLTRGTLGLPRFERTILPVEIKTKIINQGGRGPLSVDFQQQTGILGKSGFRGGSVGIDLKTGEVITKREIFSRSLGGRISSTVSGEGTSIEVSLSGLEVRELPGKGASFFGSIEAGKSFSLLKETQTPFLSRVSGTFREVKTAKEPVGFRGGPGITPLKFKQIQQVVRETSEVSSLQVRSNLKVSDSGENLLIPGSATSLGGKAGTVQLSQTRTRGTSTFEIPSVLRVAPETGSGTGSIKTSGPVSGIIQNLRDSRLPVSKDAQNFITQQKQISILQNINTPTTGRGSLSKTGTRAVQLLVPRETTIPKNITTQLGSSLIREFQLTSQRGALRSATQTRTVTIPKLPLLPPPPKSRRSPLVDLPEFNVFGIRGGRNILLNTGPFNLAQGVGVKFAKQTLGRSFFLRPTGRTTRRRDINPVNLSQFRKPGRRSRLPKGSLVERSLFALTEEQPEIQRARKRKSRGFLSNLGIGSIKF